MSLWYRWKDYQYERKCIKYFGAKPEKIYLSQRDYDTLVERINNPDPKQIESLKKLLQRKSPWSD
jgi:hypothetical protein